MAGDVGGVEFPEVDSFFLVELRPSADEFLAVWGGEEDGTIDRAEIPFLHVILSHLRLLHAIT